MVTVQVGYCLSSWASSVSARWASWVSSLLSYSKNAGFRGELRLRSSSDAEVIRSSRTGSGGTMVGSATGSGGAGGLAPGAPEPAAGGGGGAGRATGGFLARQAPITTVHSTSATTAPFVLTRLIGSVS